MNRCKVCNRTYPMNFFSHFPDEDYCHACEVAILIAIWEMEDQEEKEDDEQRRED